MIENITINGHEYTPEEIMSFERKTIWAPGTKGTHYRMDMERQIAFQVDDAGNIITDEFNQPKYTSLNRQSGSKKADQEQGSILSSISEYQKNVSSGGNKSKSKKAKSKSEKKGDRTKKKGKTKKAQPAKKQKPVKKSPNKQPAKTTTQNSSSGTGISVLFFFLGMLIVAALLSAVYFGYLAFFA